MLNILKILEVLKVTSKMSDFYSASEKKDYILN